MFVLEAYEANVVLKLYEAASARAVNISAISRFMSDIPDDFHLPKKYRRAPKTERESWSQDEDLAKLWALGVVENAVDKKVEKGVYPILLGEPGSYKPGWGFKSLLGAMWFQMRNYMLGEDNTCPRCHKVFARKRPNQIYCGEECGNRARAARGYAQKKQRQQETRKAPRRRLKR